MADSAARVRIFSDDGHCVSDPRLMRRALEYVKAFDGIVAQHAEEPRLTEDAQMHEGVVSARLGLPGWPAVAEEAIVARDVLLAEHVGARLHVCHVSTAGSVDLLRWAKRRGIRVTAEVTPHHLLLTDEMAEGYDPVFKVNPPLRTAEDVAALREALVDGVIDVVATDHAPHAVQDKDCEWSYARPGMLGLETALSIVVDTLFEPLGWDGIAERMSRRPARIAGLTGHGHDPAVGAAGHLHPGRPGRAVDGRTVHIGQSQPEHAVRRHVVADPGDGDVPARSADRPRRKGDPVSVRRRQALLVLEDGRTFHGEAYGSVGETFGEAVFTTAMTGYQETLTDPSYHRQVVVQTAPHIGNTGVNGTTTSPAGSGWPGTWCATRPVGRPTGGRPVLWRIGWRPRAWSVSAGSTPGR